jgi:hypothetical protein
VVKSPLKAPFLISERKQNMKIKGKAF